MYAFVSNEYKAVVYTQRQLDFLLSVYTYPQFKKVLNLEEAQKFFNSCNRQFIETGITKYGRDSDISYIRIEYFIDGKNIYVNVDTSHFGFIKLCDLPKNVKQDSTYDLLKIKICNVVLDDSLIGHHCTAISNILSLFDKYINIELVLPDISVFLAVTKYDGKNFTIKRTQRTLKGRTGKVFYTIK